MNAAITLDNTYEVLAIIAAAVGIIGSLGIVKYGLRFFKLVRVICEAILGRPESQGVAEIPSMVQRFEQIDGRLETGNKHFEDLDTRLDTLEHKTQANGKDTTNVGDVAKRIEDGLAELNKKLLHRGEIT